MSDLDSDSDYDGDWNESTQQPKLAYGNIITFRPSEELFERWSHIPDDTKRDAGQRMKVCALWLPVLLQYEESNTAACWAVEIGLINATDSEELNLKHLRKIETVESILRALERGTLKKDTTKQVIWISNLFNLNRSQEVLDDALCWLERTGEPNIRFKLLGLGAKHTCITALHLIFTEFAKYIYEMAGNLEKTMKSLMARPDDYLIEKSEEMKKKGNENFQKQQYEDAVKFYSKAIKYYPDNHIIYGNRALCYIRAKKYLKAAGDGKRATVIKPLWAKGHYRYCEALFSLGDIKMALDANRSAQLLCNDDCEGFKDLEQQHQKFITELTDVTGGWLKKPSNKSFKVGSSVSQLQSGKAASKINAAANRASKGSEVKMEKQSGKNERPAKAEGGAKGSKPSKSEFSSKNGKREFNTTPKKKSKIRNSPAEEEVADGKAGACKDLMSMVQDAHIALTDLRSRNAAQAFSKALTLLETITPKELGLSTQDVLLLLFGRATALTEIGQPEELAEAQKLLQKMKSFEERMFQCLVYYAMGRVYLRENRFAVALEKFSDSLQMVKNQIMPGKLTWPLTKEIVKETQPDFFKEILEDAIELCKFPPVPDAFCCLDKCLGSLKAEIYFNDPDFKGFIQICCCQSCTVDYHIACWKSLKTSSFSDKNEKDFLQEACLTPDCFGQICSIKIYGPTGLVKCKFEVSISKPKTQKKPRVNQKCTSCWMCCLSPDCSLKKLKSKEEHKLKKKLHKQSFQDKQAINDEILQKKEESATPGQQKAWLLYRDRVLLQICQNLELLREEKNLHVSALTSSLQPWLELDSSRGNQLAGRILDWEREPLDTLGHAVELLLERKNRVWARVFIQLLSSCVGVNPKLNIWACRLNDAGLNAAQSFIERHAAHLEQLDLALLLPFSPLQDMIIEKLGARQELFSSIGLTMTEYLKQAPPHDMRLFIWTLEEHRDDYVSCHSILDEYFDMMDGHCSVLKKSDENQNNSPMKSKSRGRKKKQKEPKGVIVLSGMRSVTPREEWDQDLLEDDSLSFLDPVDPFGVPSRIREQVADFEVQYNDTRRGSHYKKILDNNPDPTKESLYDYFDQILDEHGPLVAEDPLLTGELDNFPAVAQQKIQEAGGFEHFLLESLRFIKMGRCIGLAKHAVSLQQAGHGAGLDDLDDLDVAVDDGSQPPGLHEASGTGFYLNIYSSSQTEVHPILPNPYVFEYPSTGSQPWTRGENQQLYFLPTDDGELDLYSAEAGLQDPTTDGAASMTADENFGKRHAAVQTCQDAMRSVAVNTELYERFESCQGDLIKKEKSNRKLEQQIEDMMNSFDVVDPAVREELGSLEEDIQKITANIQVTNTELSLFQHKLEEEVKKDQKEKKANQEVLKSLKVETDELVEEQRSLSITIREKKSSYESRLNEFLELGNQSAAEKMSLEDEIKRCGALLASASRRSGTAQLSVVESSRDQLLHGFYRELADTKTFLSKLDEAVHRNPNQELDQIRISCRAKVEEVEKRISSAEQQYQEQMVQVKNGRRVSELLPVSVGNQQEAAAAPLSAAAAKNVAPPPLAPPPKPAATPPAKAPPAPTQLKPASRTLEPPYGTVFDKAMESLSAMFPDYSRSNLMRFLQELRSSTGGSLSSPALQEVVSGATTLILDHQDRLSSARSNVVGRGSPAQCATPPLVIPPPPVWQQVPPHRASNSKGLNMEDPCIICHEDMSPEDTSVLACRHSFHDKCIRSWLKEQSTCPTCRNHALLPDDFPALSGRRRPAP
ncbi:E3 ubiquitin-protein ligase TTC3 isoform X2 [Embiotoca jacksoni]|uniref:E3 ubiquitin-protein ligase TTC3 isoform X2 n=1 Tax=Embiotoca jacksoni TaxID=100190 RepID=UPI0037049252